MSSKEETKKKANSHFRDRGLHIFDILHLSAETVDGYSPGYAITTAGSISSSKGSSSKCDTTLARRSHIADAIFAKRSIKSICWAFGAWEKRAPRLDRVHEMCNLITLWIDNCLDNLILVNKDILTDPKNAAIWAAIIGSCTEMIYQTIHWEPFTAYRFLGMPETAAGLPCPSNCGLHLQGAHGGVCDAICQCGIIVEEKKTRYNISDASGKIHSGAQDSATEASLARTYFFVHARDRSVCINPSDWSRVHQCCSRKGCCNPATHNVSGSKEGVRCIDHALEDDEKARQVNTFLEFDIANVKDIKGLNELRKNLATSSEELLNAAANCLHVCQEACVNVWRTRKPSDLSEKQARWANARITNWNRKVRDWFKPIPKSNKWKRGK
jgi:hypothetical protein